jgi:site-specific DNA-methyltransferase (adenine-specific)
VVNRTSTFGTSARINHDSSSFYNSNLYQKEAIKSITDVKEIDFPKTYENKIILGSSENMKEIPDSCVHLMITSPPYNVTKEYDNNLTLDEYLSLLFKCFSETYRVLVNGGRACINIANVGRKPYIPFSDYISKMMIDIGFYMRGEVIWYKGSSAGVSMAWGSWISASNPILRDVHEYILVFSKGSYKRTSEGKESTITKEDFMEWTKSIWFMNTISAKKVGHPAPFPEELPRRLIHLYSFKNDIVLDPFIGSGTTAIAALKTGRRYIGYDNNPDYVALANKRLKKIKEQKVFNFIST